MAKKQIRKVMFRRKRELKTDYRNRLKYIISGKPRAIVRKTSKTIIVQIAEYDSKGDLTRVLVSSNALKKHGWNYSAGNIPAAYLTGLLAGKLAKKKNINEVVVDFGMQKAVHGSKLFAAVKGLIDAGIETNADETVLPTEERLSGKQVSEYAKSLKSKKEEYQKQFSGYTKKNADPEKITDDFKKVKEAILK